jgi:sarcosine oxidase
VAQDVGGRTVTADSRTFEPDPEATSRTEAFLRRVLPGIPGDQIYTKTCLYTLTPDRDFVIDRLPGYPNVVVAVGAGHAFKFASVIGRILSELVLDWKTESDISAFRYDRPVLHVENPVRSYMI